MTIEANQQLARRMAVVKQGLAGDGPAATGRGLLSLLRQLGCVQIDPMRVVERSHRLVLWSRLGAYDPAILDHLRWQTKAVFEYWAHAASLVLTENLPIHRHQMAAFGLHNSVPAQRQRAWMADNADLRRTILKKLQDSGPLAAQHIGAEPARSWQSSGWTNGRGVREMLELMWRQGEVVVAGRAQRGKLYALPEHWFGPRWQAAAIPLDEARRRIAEIAVGALGTGTARHIQRHFVSGLDPDLPGTLNRLVADGRLIELRLTDGQRRGEAWYALAADELLIRQLGQPDFDGRTTLLSPFDNLICDRARSQQLWGFDYRSEIYVPKEKRVYGHYVMPILHGSALAGRIDPQLDRANGCLRVHAVFAEPGWNKDGQLGRGLGWALVSLAEQLGVGKIQLGRRVPAAWRAEILKQIG